MTNGLVNRNTKLDTYKGVILLLKMSGKGDLKHMKLEEMKRNELLDFFITRISGHEKEAEIAYVLALFAAYRLSNKSAAKHEVIELTTDELVDLIETGILNQNGAGYDEEEKAWDIVLDSMEPDTAFDIIMDIDEYMKLYGRMMQPIDELKESTLKNYVSIGGRVNAQ